MKQRFTSLFLTALFCLAGMNAWALEQDGEGVYQIGTAQDLTDFAALVNGGTTTASALVKADIDMKDQGWTGMTAYAGTFDGGNFTVSNLGAPFCLTTEGDCVIRNLTLAAADTLVYTGGDGGFGAFICVSNSTGVGSLLIENCVNKTPVNNKTTNWTGGFVGAGSKSNDKCTLKICESKNLAAVSAAGEQVGGFIGSHRRGALTIENCLNAGDITAGTNSASGFVAQVQNVYNYKVTITDCLNTGAILAKGSRAAGFVGLAGELGSCSFIRCGNEGTVTAETSQAGAMLGHAGSWNEKVIVTDCYNIAEIATPSQGGALVGSGVQTYTSINITNSWNTGTVEGGAFTGVGYAGVCKVTLTNDFDVNGEQTGVTLLTPALLSSGEMTYKLNGDQSQITWFQTLGEGGDAYPVFDASHKQVFQATDMHCDGTPKGEAVYNNTGAGSQDEHDYVDGFCTYCKKVDVSYVEAVDGVFQIGTPKQLVWFSGYVNTVDMHANASLTADIDMLSMENFMPIGAFGDYSPMKVSYYGTFDGQGHVVKNLNVSTDEKYEVGLFGRTRNATIKNLGVVNVSLTTNNQVGRMGGLSGFNFDSEYTNCFTTGTITLTCTDEEATSPQMGGVVGGYYGNNVVLNNCWSTYEGRIAVGGTLNNCHYYTMNNNIAEDAVSGALCYALNKNSFLDAQWFQTVGTDEYPVLDPSHGIVYVKGESFNTLMPDDASFAEFLTDIVTAEQEYCSTAIANQDTINVYLAEVEKWNTAENFEAFCEAYRAALDVKAKVQASEAVYQSYIDLCATYTAELAASATHNADRDFFEAYLNELESVAPGEYPNGSYAYILETHLLSNEQIEEEKAYVASLMNRVLLHNPDAGTEMTILLENADFADGWNGWTTEAEGGLAIGGNKSVLTVARGLNYPFAASQTLTDIPNGIYELRVNAFGRASNDISSNYYNGQLFLNGNVNYTMSPTEGMLPEDEAEDGVNCLITGSNADTYYTDETTEVSGWIPSNMVGCSYAYKADRYLNYAAVEVTDNTLTLGVRDLGADGGNWLPFAGVRLFYLGTADEASASLDAVLQGYVDRATTIRDFAYDSGTDYAKRPNISQALKDELNTSIEAAATAATGAEKMALVNKFSKLFLDVYDCRQAYIGLVAAALSYEDVASTMLTAGIITDDELIVVGEKVSEAWDAYEQGSLTADEARAMTKELQQNPYAPVQNEKGIYEISTVPQLMYFSHMIKGGTNNLEAALTKDIEMPGTGWTGIQGFIGTFDGQGHTISNLGGPLFYSTEGNSVIRNLTLSAAEPVVYTGNEAGFGAFVCQNNKLAGPGSLLIENCVNNMPIDNQSGKNWTGGFIGGSSNGSAETLTTIRNCVNNATVTSLNEAVSGFIGNARKGDVVIENCVNNGAITAPKSVGGFIGQAQTPDSVAIVDCQNKALLTAHTNSTSRVGGIMGTSYSPRVLRISRCANEADASGEKEGAGGVVAFIGNVTGDVVIENCYNTGAVSAASSAAGILTIQDGYEKELNIINTWNSGAVTGSQTGSIFTRSDIECINCYDINGSQKGVTKVTAEQLASGEITFALNGDQTALVWYQTLGEGGDAHPVLDDTHKVVLKATDGTYYNDADGIESVQSSESTVHGEIYDLSGRRVEKPARGLYIIGGKKVLMK